MRNLRPKTMSSLTVNYSCASHTASTICLSKTLYIICSRVFNKLFTNYARNPFITRLNITKRVPLTSNISFFKFREVGLSGSKRGVFKRGAETSATQKDTFTWLGPSSLPIIQSNSYK